MVWPRVRASIRLVVRPAVKLTVKLAVWRLRSKLGLEFQEHQYLAKLSHRRSPKFFDCL